MTDRKMELIRAEDEGWAQLCSILEGLSPSALETTRVTDDWTAKDMLGHLACWWAEAACVLERIRMGTHEPEKLDLDQMNARFFDAMRDVDLHTIRAELAASRNRALEELGRLEGLPPAAHEWFYETGPCHYDEHLRDLRRAVEPASPAP
ncbi:MAG: DinB family protein [Actinomycetota bacterium]